MDLEKHIKTSLSEATDWNTVWSDFESKAADLSGEAADKSAAYLELGRVRESLFRDKDQAKECYQKAFKLDKKNVVALQAAREIFQQMANLKMVKRLLELELKINPDPQREASLNYAHGCAILNSRELTQNLEQARPFLEVAASAKNAKPEYEARFQETLYDRNNWQFALQIVYNQLTALTGSEDPLAADVVGRGEQLSNLYMKAARILQQESISDERLLPLLYKALDAKPDNTEAAFVAEMILASGGYLQHIQELQDRRISLISDVEQKIALLRDFAEVWQIRFESADMAAYFYRQALAFAYSHGGASLIDQNGKEWHLGAYHFLKKLADQGGTVEGLVELGVQGIEVIREPFDQSFLALLAGEIAWRHNKDIEMARKLFSQAALQVEHSPVIRDFVASHGDLLTLATANRQEEDHRAAEQAAWEAEQARKQVAQQAAAREAEQQQAAHEAEQVAREAEQVAQEAEQARVQAEAEQAAQAAEQAAVQEAEQRAERAAQEAEQARVQAEAERAAEHARRQIEEAEQANRASEASDSNAEQAEESASESTVVAEFGDESFTADELAVLENAKKMESKGRPRAIDAWRDAVQKLPTKRYPRERLKELYISTNKWSNVADLLKDELKFTEEDNISRKQELHWELIDIYSERLRQPGLVVTTLASLEKLLEEQGDTSGLLNVIERQQAQFEQMKRWPDLIGRVRRRAELVEEPGERTELYLQSGRLYIEKFNNQAEAIKCFESALEYDEYNAEAIRTLKELYTRRRDWEKMISIQQKELDLISDPNQRLAQLIEIARTAGEKIKKNLLSIELWNQVLAVDPQNHEALLQLNQLLEREKDWARLSENLNTLIEIESDDRKRSQFLVQLGTIYSDKVNDNQAAIRTWERLYELEPDNRRAQEQLKKLYLTEGDMNSLEVFYAKQDKWAEFIRVLENEADSKEGEARIELLLRIAELYRTRLDKADRAIRTLEKALSVDDNHLPVAEALIELYEAANDERHIAKPLEIKLAHTQDPYESLALLRRLADLAERVSKDQEKAFAYYQRAFREEHTAEDLRLHLERLAEETARWQDLVQSHEAAIEKYGDTRDSIPLRLKVAEVYEQHLNNLEAALEVNKAILAIEEEHVEALAALERLYLALGREEELLNVLGTKLSLATDEDEQAAIQTRIGGIHEQLGQPQQAISAYENVLAMGRADKAVLVALDRLYAGAGQYSELADILRRELEIAEDRPSQISLLLRLAVLSQEKLAQPEEAISLFQQILELDVHHEEARVRLEGWLDDEGYKTTVASILLGVYDNLAEWPQYIRCLEIQLEAEADVQAKVELLLRIGSIYSQKLGDLQQAFVAYQRAFKLDPSNEVAQVELERLAALESRYEEFAAIYQEVLEQQEGLATELSLDLILKLAAVYDEHLDQSQQAIRAYQRAIDIDPGNQVALNALERLYQRAENWSELLGIYRRKVELLQELDMQQDLRFRMAYLQDEMLGQASEAIATYNEILAHDPENYKAITALDRLYQANTMWVELADNLVSQLALAKTADQQIQLYLRLGELQLNKLEQPGQAVETYRQVLDIDAGNETAIAALETLLYHEEQQLTVAKILEPIYRAANDWNKLIQANEIIVKHSHDVHEKISLLHHIAELYELVGDHQDQAFEVLGRAFKEDPANPDSQRRLEGLAGQTNAFPKLVTLYEQAIPDIMDEQLVIQLFFKIAQIYGEILQDPSKEAASFERILDIDPSSFAAIDALIEVHRRTNNFDALVGAVVRKSEMVEDVHERKQLVLYAADVREKTDGDPAKSIELYQRVLALDDADQTALDALEKLYTQTENWESLKDIYQRKAELAQHDPEVHKQILHILGQVYEHKLADISRAIDVYQAILDIDPEDLEAIQVLDRLFGQAERWSDQMQILQRAVTVIPDRQVQIELRFRIGKLWEEKLEDVVQAVEAYREVLSYTIEHGPTMAALSQIAHGDKEAMLAAEVLAPIYENLTEWEKLVDIYFVMVRHMDDPQAQIARLHQIAAIYERQLGQFDQSFQALTKALKVDVSHEQSVEELLRLAEVTGEWERLATLLAEKKENVFDPNVKIRLLSHVAWIEENKLANIDQAISRYLEILENNAEHTQALAALDRIFTSLERWPGLIENIRRQMLIVDNVEAVDLQFRIGQIYQHNLHDLSKAIETYREIITSHPDHSQTLRALEFIFDEGEHQAEIAEILEPLYQDSGRWDALVKLGEVKLNNTAETADRFAIIQSIAELCEHNVGDPKRAFEWWLRAYMEDPLSEQVCEEMERLAELTQEWSYIVDIGQQILTEQDVSPQQKTAILLRSARILDQKLQDTERAVAAYVKVLEINPESEEALVALDRIYSEHERWVELATILQSRIQQTMDGELLVELEMRLAKTFEEKLGRLEDAIHAYNRVLEHESNNAQALQRLEELYLSQYRWAEVFDVYQKMANGAHTDEEMAECYQRMAKIASDALNRESEAVALWTRVLDLRGEDPLALSELAALHEAAERWEDFVGVLERQVYTEVENDKKVAIYQRLGRTKSEQLDQESSALDAWLNAFELDERNLETLTALHHIYEKNESWVELSDILARLIDLGQEVLGMDQLRDYYAEMGRIQTEHLMQSEPAIEAWNHVIEIEPGNLEALTALEDLYTAEARFQDVISVLQKRSRVTEDQDKKIELLIQEASLWDEQLGDKMQASGVYLEILELDAKNSVADEALETIHREMEDWSALTERLITRAELAENTSQRVDSLLAAAKVFEENLEDLDSAFAVLQEAFNNDYSNEKTSRELERIATVAQKWGELLGQYNSVVDQIPNLNERCELWVKIGRWYGEHLNRPDYGIQSLQKALAINNKNVHALQELANFYRRAGSMNELASTLTQLVPLQGAEEQVKTLLDLAEVQETGLSDHEAAIENLRQVLTLDENNLRALASLTRLYEAEGQYERFVETLQKRYQLAVEEDPSEALTLKKQIGEVQENNLRSPLAAIETYREVLDTEPRDRDALIALERLYLQGNRVDEYLEVLDIQLEEAFEADVQANIYEKMAKALVEMADDPLRATEKLERVIDIDNDRFDAYSLLEDLYRQLEKWTELVDTYRRHIEAVAATEQKIKLLQAMAHVYEEEIQDVDRAIDAYEEILTLDPNRYEAARTLSNLQERIENWSGVLSSLDRLIDISADAVKKVEHLTRSGRILHEKLGDLDESEVRLSRALELNPNYVPALVALANIYKEREEWIKAARSLEAAGEYATNILEKTSITSEAGFIYYEDLDDQDKAVKLFTKVLELDPEHLRTGKVLAQIFYDAANFSGADPIYDVLTRKISDLDLDGTEQCELYIHAATAARKQGNKDKALQHYQRAFDLDATNYTVLIGMADLLYVLEDWEKAFKLYQTILVQFRDSQSSNDTVLVYHRLGSIKRKQKEYRKALNYFEKALEIDPNYEPSLLEVIELQSAANDWESVVKAKRALIETAEGEHQATLYEEIGEIYLDKLANWRKAADAYQGALELKPGSYPLLHKLLDIYTKNSEWDEAIRVLDRITELEQNKLRRSRYNYTAAVIFRDQLNAHDEAIERFNEVLDDDPSFLKAFQAIDAMVTKSKDWKTLERSYRKMLKRLPPEGQEKLHVTLWSNLAEIYRTRLKDFRAAAEAFEIAARLEPENVDRHFMLAELYENLLQDYPDEFVPKATKQHEILISQEPFRYPSYHALFNIYRRSGDVDKAFCVARTLVFLKQATAPEQAFFDNYHRPEFQQGRQRLSEETLRKHVLLHTPEDAIFTGILGTVSLALARWRVKPLPASFAKDKPLDVSVDTSQIARLIKYVMNILNVSQPDVYLRENEPGDLQLMNLERDSQVRPSLALFANVLQGKNEKHLAFILSSRMLDLYLPHYAYIVLERSTQALKHLFMVCMHIAGMPVQGNKEELDRDARELIARMPGGALDQMKSLMRKFVETGGSVDVKRWAQTTELAGYRVGLLLCDDLVVAAHMISQESAIFGSTLTPKDRVKELVRYSVSEDYFKARYNIGLQVS